MHNTTKAQLKKQYNWKWNMEFSTVSADEGILYPNITWHFLQTEIIGEENCVLLGYYAARSGIFPQRFGTTYQSQLYRSRIWIFLPLKKGPIGCPETSVKITNSRCVITQKSIVFIYFASEARNHAQKSAALLDWECANVFWSAKECPENSCENYNFFS